MTLTLVVPQSPELLLMFRPTQATPPIGAVVCPSSYAVSLPSLLPLLLPSVHPSTLPSIISIPPVKVFHAFRQLRPAPGTWNSFSPSQSPFQKDPLLRPAPFQDLELSASICPGDGGKLVHLRPKPCVPRAESHLSTDSMQGFPKPLGRLEGSPNSLPISTKATTYECRSLRSHSSQGSIGTSAGTWSGGRAYMRSYS